MLLLLENELTDSTIFNGETSPQPAASATPEQQPSLLTALVGETQKYKTPEELAKAYANADQFIEQLKEENRQLREKATAAKTIDEVLERIYIGRRFKNDTERLEKLFALYTEMTAKSPVAPAETRRRRETKK
jgi:adenosine deaminase